MRSSDFSAGVLAVILGSILYTIIQFTCSAPQSHLYLRVFSKVYPRKRFSTWNGSHAIRSAYYSTFLSDKCHRLTFLEEKLNSPRASFIRELQTTYLKEDGWLGGGTVVVVATSDVYLRPSLLHGKNFKQSQRRHHSPTGEMVQIFQDHFSSDFKTKISDAYRIFAELV